MTKTKSIKVAISTYGILKEAAEKENTTLQTILDKLAKEYRTKKFFEEVNEAYKTMSPAEWAIELTERNEMDAALMDGLEEDANETW